MTASQRFFKATLAIMPTMSICEVRWSLDHQLLGIIGIMENVSSKEDYIFSFPLTEKNRVILQNESDANHIEEDIHYIDISYKGARLFVGYDGLEIGRISPLVELPKDYIASFVNTGTCLIAHDLQKNPF